MFIRTSAVKKACMSVYKGQNKNKAILVIGNRNGITLNFLKYSRYYFKKL